MHLQASSKKDEEVKERWIRRVNRGEWNYWVVKEIRDFVVEDELDACVDHRVQTSGCIQNLAAYYQMLLLLLVWLLGNSGLWW